MINTTKLDFNIIGDKSSAEACLVFIHGWKGNKNSFQRFAESIQVRNSIWVLPQAPYPVDNEKGCYSWTYEISPGKFERREPIRMILDFFDIEIFSRFNSKDVYLFGFSQGGLVCYEMIRILDKPLGGIFPIGGFMSATKKDIIRINSAQINTPIIIGHGDSDEVILKEESEIAYKLLSKESKCVDLDIYKGGHKIGLGYIKKVKEIIEKKYQ